MKPTFLSPFLGAGAEWLHLLSPHLVPLVSWMGGKRRLAGEILALLDLHPGHDVRCVLGDASWWGWVWPTCLDPVTGPEVSAMLRFWRGRDPRQLWFWLRDVGPMPSRAEAAAQLLWLQARAASGVPVWWDGAVAVQDRGWKSPTCCTVKIWSATQKGGAALVQHASTKIDQAGQRQATEPHLVQWSEDGGTRPNAGKGCHGGGRDGKRGGGIVDPGTIADRLDAIRATVQRVGAPRILHTDALSLTEEWAPRVGAAGRWYLDPPYQGATGYPASCPRDEVLRIADTAARHGGRIVLSEAVGLAAELGRGWSQVQLRDDEKPEWVTLYGCDARAHLPPILRACG